MGLRQLRRKIKIRRENIRKRFLREKRLNLLAEPGIHDFIVVLDHLKPNYNVGKIFRSADALGAREIHLVGIDFFNPLPGLGSFKHVPARFHGTIDHCLGALLQEDYTLVAMDPNQGTPLPDAKLNRRSAFIIGNEELGISFNPSDYAQMQLLQIPQVGRVQSLNASIAASIAMYEYIRQYGRRVPGD